MVTVKVEGLREIEEELNKLKVSTGRAALRRTLRRSAQPLADLAEQNAPEDKGNLRESITVSTKLNTRESRSHRKMFRDDRAAAEMFVGTNDPAGSKQEFGTVYHAPQPFMRPAWDADKDSLLGRIVDDLRKEVARTVARAEARKK